MKTFGKSLAHALVAASLLVTVIGPAHARGNWYDYYQDALKALDDGDPQGTVELLEAAMERRVSTGYFRTYGNNYIRYVPRFYLGVAYHDAGNCERALASFDLSEAMNETAAAPALEARMRSLRAACEARLAPVPEDPPVETAETAPPDAVVHVDLAMLERGLAAYLSGDLDTAVGLFRKLVDSAPESPRLRLLLGMALHGAWAIGGEQADALIDRSRGELAEAARLDPDLIPDPALCPPRVVALFRSSR